MHAYWRLTEYILLTIEHDPNPQLEPAHNLLRRLRTRKLFPFVGERILTPNLPGFRIEDIKGQLMAFLRQIVGEDIVPDDDVFCRMVKMGCGRGKLNPVVDQTTFFLPVKNDGDEDGFTIIDEYVLGGVPAGKAVFTKNIHSLLTCHFFTYLEAVSRLLPQEFEETYLRIFCRHPNQKRAVSKAFDEVITSLWAHAH